MTAITKLQVSPVFFLWLGGITHMPLQTAQACVYFHLVDWCIILIVDWSLRVNLVQNKLCQRVVRVTILL